MDSIRSWIAASILNHDEKYGADLSQRLSSPVLCQLVKITSFRTPSQPRKLVTGVVSDKTHKIYVSFDKSATDSFERSVAGENPERLTSSLRSILRLREYSYSIIPPSRRLFTGVGPAPEHELPRVQLLVHRWDVVTGDKCEPEYFPRAKEIASGRTSQDAVVKTILRKWWLGDSQKTQPSPVSKNGEELQRLAQVPAPAAAIHNQKSGARTEQEERRPAADSSKPQPRADPMRSNAAAGPSRSKSHQETPTGPTPAPEDLPHIDRAQLKSVRDVLRSHAGGKLPPWLFAPPSAAQRAALDEVTVFGLDVFADVEESSAAPEDEPLDEEPLELPPASNGSLESTRYADELQLSNGHSGESPSREHSRSQLSIGHPSGESPLSKGQWGSQRSNDHGMPPPSESQHGNTNPLASYSPKSRRPKSSASQPPSFPHRSPSPPSPSPPREAEPLHHAVFQTPPDDSEDDDEILVRPRGRATQAPRRHVFNTSPPEARSAGGETDEEDLSDYEREARRADKAPVSTSTPVPAPVEGLAPPPESQTESVSKSQESGNLNLRRWVENHHAQSVSPKNHAQSMPQQPSSPNTQREKVSSTAPPAYVLVPTTTDESMPTEPVEAVEPDNSLPEPPAPPTPGLAPRKRPRNSGATTASADADDEASLERRPTKRQGTQRTVTQAEASGSRPQAGPFTAEDVHDADATVEPQGPKRIKQRPKFEQDPPCTLCQAEGIQCYISKPKRTYKRRKPVPCVFCQENHYKCSLLRVPTASGVAHDATPSSPVEVEEGEPVEDEPMDSGPAERERVQREDVGHPMDDQPVDDQPVGGQPMDLDQPDDAYPKLDINTNPTPLRTPAHSSWEPPAGQRTPPTVARRSTAPPAGQRTPPTRPARPAVIPAADPPRDLLVSEAVDRVDVGYRPNLDAFKYVAGLSLKQVNEMMNTATQERQAEREKREVRRRSGR